MDRQSHDDNIYCANIASRSNNYVWTVLLVCMVNAGQQGIEQGVALTYVAT